MIIMGKTLDQRQKNSTQEILEPHKRELLSHAKISFGLGQFIKKFVVPHHIPFRTQERKKICSSHCVQYGKYFSKKALCDATLWLDGMCYIVWITWVSW